MDIQKFIKWATIQIKQSSFFVKLINPEEVSDPIVKAIKEIPRIPEVNTKQISDPIIAAQEETTQAVRDIPKIEIPEVDFSELSQKITELKDTLEKKDMSVNVGKTKVNVDTNSVVKAIQKLESNLPKLETQEVIDYTLMFDEMIKIMERPIDNSELKKIQKLLENLTTTSDMSVIGEWLKEIADKPKFDLKPYLDKDGRLPVKVDKVGGGGGGGLTSIETGYLKTLSDTASDGHLQVDVLSGGTTEWGYCADSLTATYQYYFFEDKSLNYKIMRETLATGVYAYATGAGSYTSVYVDSTSDPAGSPTFGTYGEIF